jgi:acyl-CoA dehydrogenase
MVTTTEFDQLLDVLRDFIRHEVMPAEADIDSSDEIPDRLIAQAKEMGLYGYALPTEYGGLGLSVEQQVRVTIELGYTSPAFRSLFGTSWPAPRSSASSGCRGWPPARWSRRSR